MDDQERMRTFLKAWARYSVALAAVQKSVIEDLQQEPVVREQAQMIFATEMGDDQTRRHLALQLALAEHQVHLQET